jgi:hypothetical protein
MPDARGLREWRESRAEDPDGLAAEIGLDVIERASASARWSSNTVTSVPAGSAPRSATTSVVTARAMESAAPAPR